MVFAALQIHIRPPLHTHNADMAEALTLKGMHIESTNANLACVRYF